MFDCFVAIFGMMKQIGVIMSEKRQIICSLNEIEYLAMRKLVADAILATPSGDARNTLTNINIKLMRDADASGFRHLVT